MSDHRLLSCDPEMLLEMARADPSVIPRLENLVDLAIETAEALGLPKRPAIKRWQECRERLPNTERLKLVADALHGLAGSEVPAAWPPDPPGPRVLH